MILQPRTIFSFPLENGRGQKATHIFVVSVSILCISAISLQSAWRYVRTTLEMGLYGIRSPNADVDGH